MTRRELRKTMKWRRAIHEAGHAVVGLALKLPVGFVTIKHSFSYMALAPERRDVGFISLRRPRGSLAYRHSKHIKKDAFGNRASYQVGGHDDHAIMSVAGGMAEVKFLNNGFSWRKYMSPTDNQSYYFHLRNSKITVEECEAKCAKLVNKHWPMIEAVAAKLLREETISGVDVYNICLRQARSDAYQKLKLRSS